MRWSSKPSGRIESVNVLNCREKIMKKSLIVLILAGAWLLSACGGSNASTPAADVVGQKVPVGDSAYTDVSVPELQTMLENKDFVFINVHVPFSGNIPNTDLSIPFDQIEENLAQLPAEKDAKIFVYCRSGSMSSVAAKKLISLGYTNVWNLAGGFNAWKQAGLPLETNP